MAVPGEEGEAYGGDNSEFLEQDQFARQHSTRQTQFDWSRGKHPSQSGARWQRSYSVPPPPLNKAADYIHQSRIYHKKQRSNSSSEARRSRSPQARLVEPQYRVRGGDGRSRGVIDEVAILIKKEQDEIDMIEVPQFYEGNSLIARQKETRRRVRRILSNTIRNVTKTLEGAIKEAQNLIANMEEGPTDNTGKSAVMPNASRSNSKGSESDTSPEAMLRKLAI